MLVLDDTQALGVLGRSAVAGLPVWPWRWRLAALARPRRRADIAVGASLAKGFGAPLAALSGSARADRTLPARERDASALQPAVDRVRCRRRSAALMANAQTGRALARAPAAPRAAPARHRRARWARRGRHAAVSGAVVRRSRLRRAPAALARLHARLRAGGVRTLLTRGCHGLAPRLSFVVTARHATRRSIVSVRCWRLLKELT